MKHGRKSKQKQVAISGAGDKQIDAIVIDHDKLTVFLTQGNNFSGGQVDTELLREVLSWIQLRDLIRL